MVNTSQPTKPKNPWPHSLPLQTTPTLSFYSHHLTLYNDLRAFTEQRAQLEKEYGNKLKVMVAKLREKELEGRKVVLLTIGSEENRKGWQEGLESRNTLLSSLSSHLNTLETISNAHLKLGDSLQSQIIDEFKKSGEKKDSARKRLGGWVEEVGAERERVEGDREKAMIKYHQSHLDLASAKQKHSKAPRDDTHLPRLLKTYKSALVGKNCAKNDYLLKVGVSRKVGEVYSDTTELQVPVRGEVQGSEGPGEEEEEEANKFGPGVARCQDEIQTQYVSSVKRVNDLLSYTSTIYSGFYTAQARYSDGITEAHAKVNGVVDADLFADWNIRPDGLVDQEMIIGSDGSKATFMPCPGHAEEPRITLGETDALGFDEPGGSAGLGPADSSLARGKGEEIIVLQNRLAKNREMKNKLEAACFGWNKEVGRQRKVIRSCEANRGLGDPDEVVEAMMITLKDLSLAELRIEALNVEIDLLEEALGDDQGAQKPHDYEKASFAIPTPCDCCKSSIWGITKPGSSCRRCGSNVHVKCANKVPAECPGGSPTHTPTPSKRMSSMFPRRESSSISDLASIASGRDREESSLRAIRRSFTSRVKMPSSDQSTMTTSAHNSTLNGPAVHPATPPILPPPHKMTDMDNLDTTGIVQMNGLSRLQTTPQPILTSPIQREIGTGRRISMFGSPTGGTGLPSTSGMISPIASPGRRRSTDVLGGFRASPGGSPVIEEEGEEFRPFGRPVLSGGATGQGQTVPPANMARVLFDFEAADDDELTVEKGTMVTVLEPDDGQGWIKVRTRLSEGSLEGLVPTGYVEVQPISAQTPAQPTQRNGTPSSLSTGYTTPSGPGSGPGPGAGLAPSPYTSTASPGNQGPPSAPGFPFSTPRIPGGFVSSPQSPAGPGTPAGPRPAGPTRGMYGQVIALYDYQAAESDEVTLVKGRTYDLSIKGRGYDAGWWELVREDGMGGLGIAPSNYLKTI